MLDGSQAQEYPASRKGPLKSLCALRSAIIPSAPVNAAAVHADAPHPPAPARLSFAMRRDHRFVLMPGAELNAESAEHRLALRVLRALRVSSSDVLLQARAAQPLYR